MRHFLEMAIELDRFVHAPLWPVAVNDLPEDAREPVRRYLKSSSMQAGGRWAFGDDPEAQGSL